MIDSYVCYPLSADYGCPVPGARCLKQKKPAFAGFSFCLPYSFIMIFFLLKIYASRVRAAVTTMTTAAAGR